MSVDLIARAMAKKISGGVTEFKKLIDTPNDYTSNKGKTLVVNTAETGLEYKELFVPYTDGGYVVEGFEGSPLIPRTGTWATHTYAKTGAYSLASPKSGGTEEFTLTIPYDSTLSFDYTCSGYTNINSTNLKIYLDDAQIIAIAGSNTTTPTWLHYSNPITSGIHVLKAVYTDNMNQALDCGLIDNITIPAGRTYHHKFEEHSNIPALIGNENKYLKVNSTGSAIEYATQTKSISFYIDGTLTAETNVMSIIAPYNLTITDIRLAVDVAPTGANLIMDLNKNGTTLFTTQGNRPTIVIDETSSISVLPDVVNIATGDKITLDIDQIGSTIAGENLSVTVICDII